MAQGTIKRLTDRGFGFISMSNGKEIFFHANSVTGTDYKDLKQGQSVTFEEGRSEKGPRAENVTVA